MNSTYTKLPALSLFYPAYNEAGSIAEAIKQALTILPAVADKFEIIVVDDGSTDATFQIAQRLSFKHPTVKVVTQSNQGYGGALKTGFAQAKYDWIFFTDADLQFDLAELQNLIPETQEHDLVLGYRLFRAEGWKRDVLAKLLKLWGIVIFGLPYKIKDIDCAFKLIHRRVLNSVQPIFSNGAMISTEILIKAFRQKFSYTQVGVNHYRRFSGAATGNNLSVLSQALVDSLLLKIELIKNSARNTWHQILPASSSDQQL